MASRLHQSRQLLIFVPTIQMNAMHVTTGRLAVALILMMGAGTAGAATFSGAFLNEAEINYGFLFSDDVNELEFLDLTFGRDMSTWNLDVQTPTQYVFSGPTVQPFRGLMQLSFEYKVPQVSFQWAEVLFDGVDYAIQKSGTASFDSTQPRRSQWSGSTVFSSANAGLVDDFFSAPAASAVPLPNSVVLMLSAVAFMGFVRRDGRAEAEFGHAPGA
jgi:hypothetical protein